MVNIVGTWQFWAQDTQYNTLIVIAVGSDGSLTGQLTGPHGDGYVTGNYDGTSKISFQTGGPLGLSTTFFKGQLVQSGNFVALFGPFVSTVMEKGSEFQHGAWVAANQAPNPTK